jgi:hypothetical protein
MAFQTGERLAPNGQFPAGNAAFVQIAVISIVTENVFFDYRNRCEHGWVFHDIYFPMAAMVVYRAIRRGPFRITQAE